jgi:hypothetical protein
VTYAPQKLKDARTFYIDTVTKAGYKIDPLSVGIVGDDSHANAGTSYHLGDDALRSDAYSIVESPRDRAGLTDAAAALDLGYFDITVRGKRHTLYTFNLWLVAQCKANTPDTRDIREVIYSPDGKVVKRWDRLGIRTTGPDSHLTHTHESWFRDSENRDKAAHLRRYFIEIGVLEDPMALSDDDKKWFTDTFVRQIWGWDPGDTDGNANGGVPNYYADKATNGSIKPAWALGRATLADILGYQIRDRIDALTQAVAKIMDNVVADDDDREVILAALQAAATSAAETGAQRGAELTLEHLGDTQRSDQEIAAALVAALGSRAPGVAAAMAQPGS